MAKKDRYEVCTVHVIGLDDNDDVWVSHGRFPSLDTAVAAALRIHAVAQRQQIAGTYHLDTTVEDGQDVIWSSRQHGQLVEEGPPPRPN